MAAKDVTTTYPETQKALQGNGLVFMDHGACLDGTLPPADLSRFCVFDIDDEGFADDLLCQGDDVRDCIEEIKSELGIK